MKKGILYKKENKILLGLIITKEDVKDFNRYFKELKLNEIYLTTPYILDSKFIKGVGIGDPEVFEKLRKLKPFK